MTAKSNCLTLLLCFSFLINYAQKNLKVGILVLNNADTTKGYIDYKEWFSNPSFILFTKEKGTPTTRFDVNDLSYFDVTGIEQYKRFTVRISMDNEALSSIGENDTSSVVRTVFLKVIEKGENVSLFSYRDGLKRRLYLLEKGETVPAELLNSIYMLNGQVKEEKQYRPSLLKAALKYLPGNGKIVSQINSAGYYDNVIGDICRKLNGNTKNIVAAAGKTRSQAGMRFFLGAGVNRGALKMSGLTNYNGLNSQPFYFPVATAGADLVINKAVGKLILRTQLHATAYKTDAYFFKDFDQYTEEYFFRFRQVNVALEPQLLYNLYNQKNLKWFVSIGAGLNFSSYPLNEQKFIRKSSTNSEAVDYNYLKDLRTFWMNGCFSTGVDFSKLELAVVFFPSSSITQTPAFGLSNSSLQLRMNYYLKK